MIFGYSSRGGSTANIAAHNDCFLQFGDELLDSRDIKAMGKAMHMAMFMVITMVMAKMVIVVVIALVVVMVTARLLENRHDEDKEKD